MKRVFGGVVVVLLAAGVVGLLYDSSEPFVEGQDEESVSLGSKSDPIAGRASPKAGVETPEVKPNSVAVGHSRVAEALGLVSTRCFVGSAYGSPDLVGGVYDSDIHDGWYSNVETALEGSRRVEQRFVDPKEKKLRDRYTFESLFVVHWKAEAPGQTVECTVEPIRYAELTVVATDEVGRPLSGARIHGCGGRGTTDDEGRVSYQVFANDPACTVRAVSGEPVPGLNVNKELAPFHEHETRTVEIELLEQPYELPSFEQPNALAAVVEGNANQAAFFDGLSRDATGPEAALYEDLAKQRRRIVKLQEKHQARRDHKETMKRSE
jgi:hypothetical protein